MHAKRKLAIASIYLLAIACGLGIGLALISPINADAPATTLRKNQQRVRNQASQSFFETSEPVSTERWAYYIPVEEIPTWIGRLGNNIENHVALKTLFDRWSKSDPAAAMRAALALDSFHTIEFREVDSSGWGGTTQFPLLQILVTISKNWLASDPDAAMAALLTIPEDFPKWRDLLDRTLPDYAIHRPAEAVKIAFEQLGAQGKIRFEQMSSGGDERLFRLMFSGWGGRAPQVAVAHAMKISEPSLRDTALRGAFDGWSGVDADGAHEWFQSLAPEDQSDALWEAMLISLSKTKPLEALELVLSTGRRGSLKSVTWDWAERDPEGMIRSAELASDPDNRSALAAIGFERMAQSHSGAEMVALAMELPDDVQQSALKMIAWHWGEQDSAAAEEWGLNQRDPILRRQFLSELYDRQIRHAPAEAAAGVSRIPDATLRNTLALKIAGSWGRASPSLAAEWVTSSVQGLAPETLAKAQESVANSWAWHSLPEALEWYSTLTDETTRNATGNGIAYVLARKQHENGIDSVDLIEATPGLSAEDVVQFQNRISQQAEQYGIGP